VRGGSGAAGYGVSSKGFPHLDAGEVRFPHLGAEADAPLTRHAGGICGLGWFGELLSRRSGAAKQLAVRRTRVYRSAKV
jgi:hypothetical protein